MLGPFVRNRGLLRWHTGQCSNTTSGRTSSRRQNEVFPFARPIEVHNGALRSDVEDLHGSWLTAHGSNASAIRHSRRWRKFEGVPTDHLRKLRIENV